MIWNDGLWLAELILFWPMALALLWAANPSGKLKKQQNLDFFGLSLFLYGSLSSSWWYPNVLSYGGKEHEKNSNYEILTGNGFEWIESGNGRVPEKAVQVRRPCLSCLKLPSYSELGGSFSHLNFSTLSLFTLLLWQKPSPFSLLHLQAGYESSGVPLYVARAKIEWVDSIGKVSDVHY